MHNEIAIYAEYLVILRLSKRHITIHAVSKIEMVEVRVVRLDNRPLEHSQLLDAPDIAPVQRLLQPPAIIHQHDDDRATVKSGPFFRRCKLILQL